MAGPPGSRVSVPIEGMSCAACVSRVEAALRSVPGVTEAAVNLVTERAQVTVRGPGVPLATLRAAVQAAGYDIPALAAGSAQSGGPSDDPTERRERELGLLRRKVLVGALLSVPILLGSFPDLFPWAPVSWRDPWTQPLLTLPIQFWVGWGFHRGAWMATVHRSANMLSPILAGAAMACSSVSVVLNSLRLKRVRFHGEP